MITKEKQKNIDNVCTGFCFGLGFGVLLMILLMPLNLKGCKGIDGKPAFRLYSEIATEQFHYLDSEAIALADSLEDSGLRAEAIEAGNLINDIREEEGLNDLDWNVNLETVANVRAKECSESFSHTRPDGSEWCTVNSKIQGGENLAFGYDNAEECVDAWMASKTHRDNILYPDFESAAISIYEEDGIYYWSEQFSYN